MTDRPDDGPSVAFAGRDALASTPERATALDCVAAGIAAAAPERVVREQVRREGDTLHVGAATYDLGAYEEVIVLGGGKAAAGVAAALESVLGDRLTGGVVVTDHPATTDRVAVREASHPVPDERGAAGARAVLDRAAGAGERTLVLAVITGGGSALLPAPAGDLSLADLRATTDALLESGASIDEINAVRKHLSAIKGGLLARAAGPATVVTLAFSDVVGDDLDVIASGPTVPDTTTYADARDVLARHDVDAPPAVAERLDRGAAGDAPETPDAGDPAFDRTRVHVLANGLTALRAAAAAARGRGYETLVLSSRVRGEAREAAPVHVAVAEECANSGTPIEPPAVILSGGECTVTVTGDGEGGPNQEFALRAAVDLAAWEWGHDPGVALASVDTDGRDGATGAAGALVDPDTVADPDAARAALADNDARGYLDGRDALVRTGRTGTNVNDLRVLVVGDPD